MVALAPAAAMLLAQAISSGPAAAPQSSTSANATAAGKAPNATATTAAPDAADRCPPPSTDSRVIVVCTQRPQGYRLNPDIMEAKRELHSGGRPVRPGGRGIPDCAHVGPAPCMTAGINLIGAALTAAQMAERLSKGEEIGSMFLTDPHPSEYQLYVAAKRRREAAEAEKAEAKKAREKAAAQKQAGQAQPAGN